MEKVTLWIILMACITFAVRYAFFMRSVPIKLNRHARQFLIFTAPCILTAMWAPIVFAETIAYFNLLLLSSVCWCFIACGGGLAKTILSFLIQ
ncbi:MAG: branched-chain amino acid ABC transporter [Gammaproteobacteria bacterium]|nr:MAG: branched-chain amino acid ABC transporter [Gammaproteobacteria bacterium]